MDTIVFDGVEYVKASVVAKQFRYTADYIGQLCRSKKIDARLVGRTWFVNIDSILKYRTVKKNKITVKAQNKPEITIKIKPVRREVFPVIKNKTAQVFTQPDESTAKTKKLHVFYDLDDESLLPNLTKKILPAPKKLSIKPADALRIHIGSTNKSTISFEPEELPTVALRGSLVIEDYPEIELEPVVEDSTSVDNKITENKAITDERGEESKVILPVKVKEKSGRSIKVDLKKMNPKSAFLLRAENKTPKAQVVTGVETVKTATSVPHQFTPSAVLESPVKSQSLTFIFLPLMVTFLAISIGFMVWSLSVEVYVADVNLTTKFIFSLDNFKQILNW